MEFRNFENGCEMIFDDDDFNISEEDTFNALTPTYDESIDGVISATNTTVRILSKLNQYVTFRVIDLIKKSQSITGVVTDIQADDENLVVAFINEDGDEAEAAFGLEAITVRKFVFDQKTYRIAAAIRFDGILEDDNSEVKLLLVIDNYADDRQNPVFQDENGNCILGR